MDDMDASKLEDVIEVDEEEGEIIIDTDQLEDFKLQNVSQGRISMESELRDKIGIRKDGQVLVTRMGKGFFIGKAVRQHELDQLVRKDLIDQN